MVRTTPVYCRATIIVLLIVADSILSMNKNETIHDVKNNLEANKTRRYIRHGKSLSTSSESGDHRSEEGSSSSLGISSESSSSGSSNAVSIPKSSKERRGWRKWHRKCTLCPNDMLKKWRDRTISWICGGYQRARRSFKSTCMMHYRNCQDGTMFVKIHDYRCENDTEGRGSGGDGLRHGLHFFYEYGRDSQDSGSNSRSASSSIHISSEFGE